MRFTENISAKADNKGRLFLSALFRKILQIEEEVRLVLRCDAFQRCLIVYPERVWNQMINVIVSKTSPFDKVGHAVLRQFVAETEIQALDVDGRMLIPKRCQRAANLPPKVHFTGVNNVIELWAKRD